MHDCSAKGVNAERLFEIAERYSLTGSGLRDFLGRRIVSWHSPNGFQTVRDYVVFPVECLPGAKVVWLPEALEPLGLVDHSPVVVELTWTSLARSVGGKVAWDVGRMRTEEGKAVIRRIHGSAPRPAWSTHPDDHLHLLNNYYFRALQTCFPASSRPVRTEHFSNDTWRAVTARRQVRHLRRVRDVGRRLTLEIFLRAWRVATFVVLEAGGCMNPQLLELLDKGSVDVVGSTSSVPGLP